MWCGVSAQSKEGVRYECYYCVAVVGVDLAKIVFQLAVADGTWRVIERIASRAASSSAGSPIARCGLVVMEACGSAHHWARWLQRSRHRGAAAAGAPTSAPTSSATRPMPPMPAALLEAARCADIVPVRVKSIEQQALQGLHRTRSLWMATRTSRINALRGFCREFGIAIAQGSRLGRRADRPRARRSAFGGAGVDPRHHDACWSRRSACWKRASRNSSAS